MACASTLGFVLICTFLVILQFEVSESAKFYVGDSDGWTYDTVDWPNGKSFKAGDVLVFKYYAGIHNVVVVDAAGYDNCSPTMGSETAQAFDSGNDRFTLAKGDNYFICSVIGHCNQGMKIYVKAK